MPYFGTNRTKTKTPIVQSKNIQYKLTRLSTAAFGGLLVVMMALGSFGAHIASAQSLQQQINELNGRNQRVKSTLSAVEGQAGNYEEAIADVQAQIDAVLGTIRTNEKERDRLSDEITKKTAELAHQRSVLGQNIRAMYIEEDMSTFEMVITSKNLSEYLDKQQYRNSVQNKINMIVKDIKAIQAKMETQKAEKETLIAQQKEMQSQLSTRRAEQQRLLSMNKAQQGALNEQLRSNSGRIAELRRQQAAENARLVSSGGGRTLNVPDTTGYPWANVQPFPNSYPDPWGMYKRQCVSYTAWKVYKDGKYMPYWGGRGNAKNWANNARSAGIPVHSTPQRGDIAVSTRGTYGHVMYVEQVLGNGMMRISQYNAGWDGRYSEAIISTAGLEYVRFQNR